MSLIRFFILGLSLFGILASATAEACKLKSTSRWYAKHSQLVKSTNTIVIGKLTEKPENASWGGKDQVKYTFEVTKVLKGKLKSNSISILGSSADGPNRVSYAPDCSLRVSFEPSKTYLLFVDSFHPDGYKEVSGAEDSWALEVEQLIGSAKPSDVDKKAPEKK